MGPFLWPRPKFSLTRFLAVAQVLRGHIRAPTRNRSREYADFYPLFNEGEVVAAWGNAQLIKYLDGKTELRGGSDQDRAEAKEWMSLFWHEAVGEKTIGCVDGAGYSLRSNGYTGEHGAAGSGCG